MSQDRRRPQRGPEKPEIHFDDINIEVGDGHSAQILHLIRALHAQGAQTMAQIDDLRSAQALTGATLDLVAGKVTEIDSKITPGSTGGTPPMDLSDVVASAQGLQSKAAALQTQVQAVDDKLNPIVPPVV